jgi:hypothetical protein
MSNALGVASVSFVLVDLLNNGLIDRDISASLGDVLVSALSPDQVDALQAKSDAQSRLNLFLYNVTQNQGWRNVGYPSRDASGDRIDNPPLALDLHYLLTAYGTEQYHAEILLGYGMQLFHETPVLPRAAILKSLSAPSQVSYGTAEFPASLLNLYTSGLADQVEQIKIWPQTLTTEEISRLWTAFQAKYRPTAAYQASVVLIQSQASTKSALPVRQRTVTAIPFNKPVIGQVLSLSNTNPPTEGDQPILPGYSLVLVGSQLKGAESTSVLIAGEEVFPASSNITSTKITVPIPADTPAGTQQVQVIQQLLLGSPLEPHRGVESDPATFVLRPAITKLAKSTGVSTTSGNPVTQIDVTLTPPVNEAQKVVLLLNQVSTLQSPIASPLAYTFQAPPLYSLASPPMVPPPPVNVVSIPYVGVQPGNYLVRVQVDGAESLLTQDSNGFFNGPQVSL